jgi:hypothetical protein
MGELKLSLTTYQSLMAVLEERASGAVESHCPATSLSIEEVLLEMVEVKGLADELGRRREVHRKKLAQLASSGVDSTAEAEVVSCQYHLSARARPHSMN